MGADQVTVVATRLQLRGWRQIRRFFQLNGAIKRQLKVTPGVINYWLRADFLRLRFYTISVWEDDRSMSLCGSGITVRLWLGLMRSRCAGSRISRGGGLRRCRRRIGGMLQSG